MRWSPTEEQDELRRTVRRFLEETSPTTEVRRLMETPEGYEPGVWKRLGQELGLPGVHVPEAYGGQGLGFAELGIALEELGRALYCGPYFSTVALAANAVLNAGTESQKAELLPALASGESIATLAVAEPSGRWDLAGIELQAQRVADGFTLFGEKTFVTDGLVADRIIVAARRPKTGGREGVGLFHLRGDAEGLERRPLTALDPTRKLARLSFRGARAEPLGEVGNAAVALERTLDQAAALLANEMVGGAQRLLEMTVDYAKTRVQFGRPIGSFQAIKHKCADMLLALELARSSAQYAAGCADESPKELPSVASLAKAQGSDAYLEIAAEAIQIHGGLGFTWEQDVHLYFKRAKASEVFLGDPTYHRELFAQRIGL
jgi:alkylation response protein AidB-like acyl-CoA dehydrogenase